MSHVMVQFCILTLHSEGIQKAHFVPYFLSQEQPTLFFSSALSPGGQLVDALGSRSPSQDINPTLPPTAIENSLKIIST